jgi:hypothetical protein
MGAHQELMERARGGFQPVNAREESARFTLSNHVREPVLGYPGIFGLVHRKDAVLTRRETKKFFLGHASTFAETASRSRGARHIKPILSFSVPGC